MAWSRGNAAHPPCIYYTLLCDKESKDAQTLHLECRTRVVMMSNLPYHVIVFQKLLVFPYCARTRTHTCTRVWLQRNAIIHQGRVLSEEAMVKMIRWEVKVIAESSSYSNSSSKQGNLLSLGHFRFYTNSSSWCRCIWYLSDLGSFWLLYCPL